MSRLSTTVAPFVVFGLVGLGVPASAGQTAPPKADAKPATTPAPAGKATTTTSTTSTTGVKAAAKAPATKAPAPARPRVRRATSAQVRAAQTSRELATTSLPRYTVDASGELVPDLHAAAAIILDPRTNEVLWEENSQSQRSIASITKVMTAVVFLENNPDPKQVVPIVRSDVYRASTTKLRLNDKVTVDDLLHLLLIPSDNAAARALARVSPQGSAGFIDAMNRKAAEMGLTSTHYADPSGLLSDNVSSAYDMARLIAYASSDERISSVMRTEEYTVRSPRRTFSFRSTYRLLDTEGFDVRAAKTGFITKSGYCLATLLQLPQGGQQVAVVVLGARSNAGRFLETQNLVKWLSNKTSTIFATTAATPQD